MKERFTTEEWDDLKYIPVTVFFLVAGADGKVDKKEVKEFSSQMARSTTLKDELHRELLVDIAENLEDALARVGSIKDAKNYIARMKGVLKSKLSDAEYQRFIGSLFLAGLSVANASGPLFGSNVSKKEREMLAVFGMAWDLDPESISKNFGA